MRFVFFKTLAILFIGALAFGACKKYPEDDGNSSGTAKKRLTKTWNLVDIKVNNVDVIFAVALEKVEFKKDGECIFTYSTTTNTYQWEFIDKKSKIKITGGYERSLYILKLTNSELKWREEETSPEFKIWTYSFDVSE